MFKRAEILFVCTANTGLARMAEGAMWARLGRAGLAEQYSLHAALLPTDLQPAAGDARGRDELGGSYVLLGQTVSEEWVNQADLVLVMSRAEQRAVLEHFAGARMKTCLLSEMAGPARDIAGAETPTTRNFERLCRDIQALVDAGFDTILSRADAARAATMAGVGMSTGTFHYEFIRPSLDETLALFQRVGARFAEFSWNIDDDHVVTPEEMAQYSESFDAHNLRCESVHGFENTRVHAVTEGEALNRYVAVQGSLVELCARLGGDAVVLHLPGLWWGHLGISLQEALERSTVSLDRLRPLCEKLGVRLAVENYREQSSSERLDFYFSRYPEEFMAFCLDTGHANLVPGEMEEMKAYASRLCALHLHDNLEVEDDHQPPFFGTIDWPGLLDWLHEIDYARSLNFELIYDRHLFPGSPAGFVGYGTERIRQALSLNPALIRRDDGRVIDQT